MRLPLYQIDAFTSEVFCGNPAAVCPLESWLDDRTLQNIAAENNLSETAFFVPEGDAYHLRWFTPTVEVVLCGHATLATAHVLYEHLGATAPELRFRTQSGVLTVTRQGDRLTLDFPAWPPSPIEAPPELSAALGASPREVLTAVDLLAVFETESQVRDLRPNLAEVEKLREWRGVIVTAPGDDCDFVSRFFAPQSGIPEDPVTGSAHCALTPYWAARLGKSKFQARQVSARGGELFCELRGERVVIAGRAVRYLEGAVFL